MGKDARLTSAFRSFLPELAYILSASVTLAESNRMAIKETQIQATLRFHLTPAKTQTTTNVDREV
jgi:hypothetical protein